MSAPLTGDAARLLAESGYWRVLSLLFERPHRPRQDDLVRLAEPLQDSGLKKLIREGMDLSEGDYLEWLGPGGKLSPRAASYLGTDPGQNLAGLAGLYQAFGYQPAGEDPPDHLAVECGFLAYLYFKEAFACEQNHPEAAEVTRRARGVFIAEHLAPLLSGFTTKAAGLQADLHFVRAARRAAEALAG